MGKGKVWLGIAIVVAIGMFVLGSVYAEEKGLLGYWKFDEGKGDVVKDSSGQGNDGKMHNAEWVKGKFGSALYFNGEAYVSIPAIKGLDGSSELTVGVWVLWENTGKYPNIITGGVWNPGGFMIFVADNVCTFRMGKPGKEAWDVPWKKGAGQWEEASAPLINPFSLGKWYHLVATFKRPEIKTYVNGQPAGLAKWDYPVGQTGEMHIGKWELNDPTAGPSKLHYGMIDEVKIYNRALAPEEIKASFDKEKTNRGAVQK